MISCETSPHFNWKNEGWIGFVIRQWKGKVGLEVLEGRGRRMEERSGEEDGAAPHGLEKLQVRRNLIAEQGSS